MVELSYERIGEILQKETWKTEGQATILRAIYTRYMLLFERYFADIDALNDEKIAELKQYDEETKSFVKYFYMDIPEEIAEALHYFDREYSAKLLGPDWSKLLTIAYKEFRLDHLDDQWDEARVKDEFKEQNLSDFYDAMDRIFRDGFGTGSRMNEEVTNRFASFLFGTGK